MLRQGSFFARGSNEESEPYSVHAELVEALSFSSGLEHNRLKKKAILRQAQDRRVWGAWCGFCTARSRRLPRAFARSAALALLLAAFPVRAAPDQAQAEVRALQADDARLLAIGYRLVTANAPWCADKGWVTGLLPIDAAAYDKPGATRAIWGIAGDFAVEAVLPGSPAALAGLTPGTELVAIGDKALADPAFGRPGDPARLDRIQAAIGSAIMADGKARIRTGTGTVLLGGLASCRSDFELLTQGSGANADGTKVQISQTLLRSAADEDEAAFFVAHEFAHNVLRHNAKLNALGRGSTAVRETEREADRLALWLMANAGFKPAASVTALARESRKLKSLIPLPDHGRYRTRIEIVKAELVVLYQSPIDATGKHDWRTRFTPWSP